MSVQSNLYKMITLGTTQKLLSWGGGHFMKHLYKTTTKQMWSFLAGFEFFSIGNIYLDKKYATACVGAILED